MFFGSCIQTANQSATGNVASIERLLQELPDEPFISVSSCEGCDGRCCYGGVYLTKEDEERVETFVRDNKDYFAFLPEKYIVASKGWYKRLTKTAEKPFDYGAADLPKHFTQTKCVFSLDSGECALQRRATDLLLHPWHAKPTPCWLFPIRVKKGGRIAAPAVFGKPETEYVNENTPVYSTSLPCTHACEQDGNAKSWKEVYFNEIMYHSIKNRFQNL